ncbi:MAG: hypothetical protein ABL997_08770 [Planctomycetota bacterium]
MVALIHELSNPPSIALMQSMRSQALDLRAQDVEAQWRIDEHHRLTLLALRGLQSPLSPQDINNVAYANEAADLEVMSHKWYRFIIKLWPAASAWVNDVRDVRVSFASAFPETFHVAKRPPHCDDLFSYDEISLYWTTLERWSGDAAKELAPGGRQFTALLGVVHHAVQDFYCHSNWVYLYHDVFPEAVKVPTWQEVHNPDWAKADPIRRGRFLERIRQSNRWVMTEGCWTSDVRRSGGLQTGSYNMPFTEDGLSPWKHRHPDEGTFEHLLAYEVSVRATVEATKRLLQL